MSFAILVHGGAGPAASDDVAEQYGERCLAAARRGHALLREGRPALDVVEAAAVALEDDPLFNAGTGSCLNADGEVEMDASIMDGASLSVGAVAAVRAVRNPVLLARAVMERTSHVLLAGDGAEQLARELGVPACDPKSLITEGALRAFRLAKEQGHGTIGAVAVDAHGHVAAATSTGGVRLKRRGRVGDSPVPGAGIYADDLGGAVSCTGQGEAILRVVLAKKCSDLLSQGLSPQEAARRALAELERVGGTGGLIAVDRHGTLAWAHNTQRMTRAWIDARGAEGWGFWPRG